VNSHHKPPIGCTELTDMNDEFLKRRQRLIHDIGKDSIAILASAPRLFRNSDVEVPYRQNSDFHYLTGFDEPEAIAVIAPGQDEGEFILFCREFDPLKALWTGHYAGTQGAKEHFLANQAHPIETLGERLPDLLMNRRRVYFLLGDGSEDLDKTIFNAVRRVRTRARTGVTAPYEFLALEHLLHEYRLSKSEREIELMDQAAQVSVEAHKKAMKASRPGMMEYEIEAVLLNEFNRKGMRAPAYPSIVAAGANACVLHYTENRSELKDGDLLLIDAGVENHSYASDITRTFPISGTFTEPQKQLYELVLKAQLAAIEIIKPGCLWNQPHDLAIAILTEGLIKLGLLIGERETLVKEEAYKRFYMHRTGHWLGMDVHDVGDYMTNGEWRSLEEGMVLTVEPGLYVPNDSDIDPCWRGIGIRIEDDVLVTQTGYRVLTAGLPKTVVEIESYMAG